MTSKLFQQMSLRPLWWVRKLYSGLSGPCALCMLSTNPPGLCKACQNDLPGLKARRCFQCACVLPLGATSMTLGLCPACVASPPAFDRSFAAFDYAMPADALILRLKSQKQLWVAPVLAALMTEGIRSQYVGTAGQNSLLTTSLSQALGLDILVAVPSRRAGLIERGFNPASLIASALSKKLACPVRHHLLVRQQETEKQSVLSRVLRQKISPRTFEVSSHCEQLSIGVVDDVMTTGSTLQAIALALKAAGAKQVINFVAARTPA